jgi:tetraacyldisaccharide 4'-kinase
LDLLLISGERGFGNGWVLPAGPLRERCQAATRAHAVVILAFDCGVASVLTTVQWRALRDTPTLHGTIRPHSLLFPDGDRWREAPAESLGGRRVMALSGIADSRSFYAMLRELEADLVGVLEYPDHHNYSASDWREIRRAAMTADLVVTTEKDLVKLVQFPFARNEIAALSLEIDMGADADRLLALAVGRHAAGATCDSAKEN